MSATISGDAAVSDATTEEVNAESSESTTETVQEEVNWQDKYEAQQKVNRDLENKFKNATSIARKNFEAEYVQKAQEEAALKAKPAEEQAIEAAKAEARAEATAKADARILRSELKAAATGKLADPTDAALYINLSDFTVNDDGDVDSDALNDAIAALLEKKPHLAAQKQSRFDGGADQGAKGKASKPAQLTQTELDRMSPSEVVQAQKSGRLNSLLGIH